MKFAVAVFLLAAAVQVYALPGGAPAAACPNIFPVGHTSPANQVANPTDITATPYQLSLQGFRYYIDMQTPGYRYYPGAQYYLTIQDATNGASYRGLLVQARLAADDTTAVGTFSDFTDNTEASACTPTTSAVTHSNPMDKICEVLTWTAPANGTGDIRFFYAVVQEFTQGTSNRFYATLVTTTIEESAEMPSGNNPTCVTPPDLGMGGDPHYSVLLPNGQLLCFSVHGNRDFSFNLISNNLMHMNALFIPDPVRDEITWIGSLGIVVRNTPYKKSNVTKLRFEAREKKVYIGDEASLDVKNVEKLVFLNGKLIISEAPTLRKIADHPEVHVDLQDIGIGFKVRFMKNSLDMTWEKVDQQPRDSHGLIGQFFRKGVEIDETRKLLMLPTMDPVPVMRRPVWSFMEREVPEEQLCWAAMNWGYQGKGLIEGHYLDYLVDSVLSGDFKFKARHQQQ